MIDGRADVSDNSGMQMRIAELLRRRGMSQSDLAEAVGVNKGYVSELVHHKKYPSYEMIERLTRALDVEPGELFERRRQAPVIGIASGNGSVEISEGYETGGRLYEVAPPADLPADEVVAVEVRTDALLPLIEPADLLFFSCPSADGCAEATGHVALCLTQDGRALIRRVLSGRLPNTFDLHPISAPLAPEYGVTLDRCGRMRRHLFGDDIRKSAA